MPSRSHSSRPGCSRRDPSPSPGGSARRPARPVQMALSWMCLLDLVESAEHGRRAQPDGGRGAREQPQQLARRLVPAIGQRPQRGSLAAVRRPAHVLRDQSAQRPVEEVPRATLAAAFAVGPLDDGIVVEGASKDARKVIAIRRCDQREAHALSAEPNRAGERQPAVSTESESTAPSSLVSTVSEPQPAAVTAEREGGGHGQPPSRCGPHQPASARCLI